jgi:hypothetical protein
MNRAERRRASRKNAPPRQARPASPSRPAPVQLAIPPEGRDRDVDHAVRLRRLADRRAALERELQVAIEDASRDGMSLAAIGRVVGMTRQSVWQRVHGLRP